jgi:hypothetical protein
MGQVPVQLNRNGATVIDPTSKSAAMSGAEGSSENLNQKRNRHALHHIDY